MRGVKAFLLVILTSVFTLPASAQFTSIGLENREIEDLQLHGDHLYAGTNQGLYQLDLVANGSNWQLLGLEDKRVSSFVIFSQDSLLVGTWEENEGDSVYLYATFDGGSTWQPYQNDFGSDSTYRSVVDVDWAGPGNDTLYAVSREDIYRSSDKGKSWNSQFISDRYRTTWGREQDTYAHSPMRFEFIETEFQGDSAVYAGGHSEHGGGVLMLSSDAGKNWKSNYIFPFGTPGTIDDSIFVNDAVLSSFHPKNFLAAGPTHILTSYWDSHGKLAWRKEFYRDKYEFADLAVHDKQSDIVYAGGHNKRQGLELFKSENEGNNWSVFKDSTSDVSNIRKLVIHEELTGGTVFLGTEQGVYQLNQDAEDTPADLRPTVNITSPPDSSTRYYSKIYSNYYDGIELEISGEDKDGQIKKYGWAIGDDTYRWTSDTSITIDEYHFGSAGNYTVRVTAIDDDSIGAKPDTIRIELVEPSLDEGLLVVDGTNEEHINRASHLEHFTDSYIDSLYKSWIAPQPFTQWDVKEQGLPSREELGRYASVFWHADKWSGVSEHAHKIGEHKAVLGDYMSIGGNVIISGWRIMDAMYPGISYPSKLEESAFANRYLKIKEINKTRSAPPGEFTGAYGIDEYPDVVVDSSRIDGYPVSFYDHMIEVIMIQDSSERASPIFTFRCREDCGDNLYRGQVVAHQHSNGTFHSAIVGFPIIFLKYQDAAKTVQHLMNDFGYKVTSTPNQEKPDSYSLKNNYPNPFNPTTNIQFSLPQASEVQLTVYDVLGRRVAKLIDGKRPAGQHSVTFNASNLSSGVYIYRLKTDGFSESRNMLLVK